MREKAEQMAKNAEIKIQQAQIKEQKYNGFTILSLMVAIPYIMKFLGKNYFILQMILYK